ncbi:DUF397 domain-containing protein [Micromonospora zhanjiangensis]|uniref:DUF397 domain-containing protein n=1 Tax=Micromonospora zhanjiangensis TaxID=1522057 RepID=A0ABV8KPF2_9ACTN
MSDPQFTNTTDPRFTAWRKSTKSGNEGTCVFVAESTDTVAVADSKAGPDAPIVAVDRAAFAAFIGAVKAGTLTA